MHRTEREGAEDEDVEGTLEKIELAGGHGIILRTIRHSIKC